MAVTVTARTAGDKTASLVTLQAHITALAAAAATPSNQQLLAQRQVELVRGCLDCGRLSAAAIISQFSSVFTSGWLAKFAPSIALLTTAGNQPTQLVAAQIQAVDDATSQGLLHAADVLSTLT